MDKTGRGFQHVRNKFPNVSDAKIKDGIFIGPQIRERQTVRWRPEWDWKKCVVVIKEDLPRLLMKSQSSELSGCCAGPVDFVKSYGMQYEYENPLSGVILEFFPGKSRRSQWRTRWKVSPRHYGYGKAVPRQVHIKYVGRLLLDTEDGCTWRQIPAKVIWLYI